MYRSLFYIASTHARRCIVSIAFRKETFRLFTMPPLQRVHICVPNGHKIYGTLSDHSLWLDPWLLFVVYQHLYERDPLVFPECVLLCPMCKAEQISFRPLQLFFPDLKRCTHSYSWLWFMVRDPDGANIWRRISAGLIFSAHRKCFYSAKFLEEITDWSAHTPDLVVLYHSIEQFKAARG